MVVITNFSQETYGKYPGVKLFRTSVKVQKSHSTVYQYIIPYIFTSSLYVRKTILR